MKMRNLLLLFLILLMIVVHQDLWNWAKTDPMLFGFLPVGLTYHAGYSVACAILMAILVKLAWPVELERDEAVSPTDVTPDVLRHD